MGKCARLLDCYPSAPDTLGRSGMQHGAAWNAQIDGKRRLIENALTAFAAHHVRKNIADPRFGQQHKAIVGELQRPPSIVNASAIGYGQHQIRPARDGIYDFAGRCGRTLAGNHGQRANVARANCRQNLTGFIDEEFTASVLPDGEWATFANDDIDLVRKAPPDVCLRESTATARSAFAMRYCRSRSTISTCSAAWRQRCRCRSPSCVPGWLRGSNQARHRRQADRFGRAGVRHGRTEWPPPVATRNATAATTADAIGNDPRGSKPAMYENLICGDRPGPSGPLPRSQRGSCISPTRAMSRPSRSHPPPASIIVSLVGIALAVPTKDTRMIAL